jgi:hypothetical protein
MTSDAMQSWGLHGLASPPPLVQQQPQQLLLLLAAADKQVCAAGDLKPPSPPPSLKPKPPMPPSPPFTPTSKVCISGPLPVSPQARSSSSCCHAPFRSCLSHSPSRQTP